MASRRAAGLGLIALLLTVSIGALSAHAAAPSCVLLNHCRGITWSAPEQIEHGFGFGTPAALTAVSCPSSALCVGVTSSDEVVTSTDPGDAHATWTPTLLADGARASLTDISCPTVTLCVASGPTQILYSANPTGGPGSWVSVTGLALFPETSTGGTLSCPTATLCVGVAGNSITTTTDPTGSALTWKQVATPGVPAGPNGPGTDLSDVSCASASLCVAVGSTQTNCSYYHGEIESCNTSGVIAYSTNPAAGPWIADSTGPELGSVACPTIALCVGFGGGDVFTTTDPTGGGSTWSAGGSVEPAYTASTDLSCASPTLCVAVDDTGSVMTSTDPTGGHSAWSRFKVDPHGLASVSCLGQLCVAVGSNVVSSTDPTTGADSWSLTGAPSTLHRISGLSCGSVSSCVAVDTTGNVFTSTDPTSPDASWEAAHVDGRASLTPITGIACPAAKLCVAVDSAGNALSSTDAPGGAPWSIQPLSGASHRRLVAVTCPSERLCVAVDRSGYVVSTTHPSGGASRWRLAHVSAMNRVEGISCPTRSLCVAVNDDGQVVSSTDPTGDAGKWHARRVDHHSLLAIDCPSVDLCVAVDSFSEIVTSTDPTAKEPRWKVTNFEYSGEGLSQISCASQPRCFSFGDSGAVAVSTDPAGGARAWAFTYLTNNPFESWLDALACPTSSTCVGLDNNGNALVGHP